MNELSLLALNSEFYLFNEDEFPRAYVNGKQIFHEKDRSLKEIKESSETIRKESKSWHEKMEEVKDELDKSSEWAAKSIFISAVYLSERGKSKGLSSFIKRSLKISRDVNVKEATKQFKNEFNLKSMRTSVFINFASGKKFRFIMLTSRDYKKRAKALPKLLKKISIILQTSVVLEDSEISLASNSINLASAVKKAAQSS